jgi:hypothetical protein
LQAPSHNEGSLHELPKPRGEPLSETVLLAHWLFVPGQNSQVVRRRVQLLIGICQNCSTNPTWIIEVTSARPRSWSRPNTELRKITVDRTIEFARLLHANSPDAVFSFLSGNGADPTGRSRIGFARYKGEAENGLVAAGFSHVYSFRPAYIYPVEPRRAELQLPLAARKLSRI